MSKWRTFSVQACQVAHRPQQIILPSGLTFGHKLASITPNTAQQPQRQLVDALADQMQALAGATYQTSLGKRVQLSPLAAMTTDRVFATPSYSPANFPAPARIHPSISVPDNHFLCQCARLVYEDTAIIQDVVKHR